jgi:5-methyltetrahydrofolate--homocysteine methyltransferase
MERQGFTIPLLIGGATTSKAHTAVKIAPSYSKGVVHVLDASRAVGVANSLLNPGLKADFLERISSEYAAASALHQHQRAKPLLPIQTARSRKPVFDWRGYPPPKPSVSGLQVLTSAPGDAGSSYKKVRLEDVVPFIDWSPFFHTWEMRGRYPAILEKPEAKKLFEEAQALLATIVKEKSLTLRGVYGFFPAAAQGDDVVLLPEAGSSKPGAAFHFLRQQIEKPAAEPNLCLADFIAPIELGVPDYLGAFAVSAGFGADELAKKFERDLDDYNAIMVKALADRLAEAFAEYLHKQARDAWGFGQAENLTTEELIREKYQGIRPAAGYPACPDHTEKATLWKLLDAKKNTGIELTESFAMWPGASVSGLYFSHPESKYFAVGKIARDQVLDYQRRKGMPLAELERWLGPWLSYDADGAVSATPAVSTSEVTSIATLG